MFSSIKRAFGGPRSPARGDSSAGAATPHSSPPAFPKSSVDGLLSEFDTYSAQLRTLADAVISAEAAAESLAAGLLGVAEAIAPLAGQNALPGPAAELLHASTSFASDAVPNFVLALQALALRPLRSILRSHAEITARGAERANAAAEYAAASKELSALQRRGAGRAALPRSRGGSGAGGGVGAGVGGGDGSSKSNSVAASDADARARVVRRLVAAQALRTALDEGLSTELRALSARRTEVVKRLFFGLSGAFAALGEGAAGAFDSCVALDASAPVPSSNDSAGGARARTALKLLVASTTGAGGAGDEEAAAWYDEGGASRALARARAAADKEAARSHIFSELPRDVPMSACAPRAVGASAASVVFEGHAASVWLPRVLRGLPLTLALPLARVSRSWRDAITGGAGVVPRSALAWGGLVGAADAREHVAVLGASREARTRLRMWLRLLGGGGAALVRWASVSSRTAIFHDATELASALAIAAAEGAMGGKGARALRDDVRGSPDEDDDGSGSGSGMSSGARWMELIEQDVARSYTSPFGSAGVLARGAERVEALRRRRALNALTQNNAVAAAALRAAARMRALPRENQILSATRSASAPAVFSRKRGSAGARDGPSAAGSTLRIVSCVIQTGAEEWVVPSLRRLRRASAFPDVQVDAARRVADAVSEDGGGVLGTASASSSSGGAMVTDDGGIVSSSCDGVSGRQQQDECHALASRTRALRAVLLAVAASEPQVRYVQGMHAVARFLLEVAAAGGAELPPSDNVLLTGTPLDGIARSDVAAALVATNWMRVLLSATNVGDITGGGEVAGISVTVASVAAAGAASARGASFPAPLQLRALFQPDMRSVRLRLYQLDRLLLRRAPELHAHLTEIGVRASSYAAPWLLTLFAGFTALDARSVARVWDVAFAGGGWAPLLASALAVTVTLAPLLVNAPLEECLVVLAAPRVYYGLAAEVGEVAAGLSAGGATRGGNREADVVHLALTNDVMIVTAEELVELEDNWRGYEKCLEDA